MKRSSMTGVVFFFAALHLLLLYRNMKDSFVLATTLCAATGNFVMRKNRLKKVERLCCCFSVGDKFIPS